MPEPSVAERVAAVRARMAERRLDALVVPRADEYLGEWLPPRGERLRWLSGFTGSAGVLLLLAGRAAMFVDGRYTVQARRQLDESLFEILGPADEPHMRWLAGQLEPGAKVGHDPRLHSLNWRRSAAAALDAAGQELVETEQNLIDLCWRERPAGATRPGMLLADSFCGRDSHSKRRQVGELVAGAGAEAAYVFAPDSCNWLLNLRGRDVPNLPVVLGSGILHADGRMRFFAAADKLPEGFAEHAGAGVSVHPEAELPERLARLAGRAVLCDPAGANAWSLLLLRRAGARLIERDDPVLLPRACKSERELEGARRAHVRDAAAKISFLAWLDSEVAAGRLHDEALLAERLEGWRARQENYLEPSFDTISAAAGNAAMCHYNHRDAGPARLEMDSVYLVDSGGQYLDGTTDITRTVAIGDPGREVRERFTLVLKGMIALAETRFPEGTTGAQLDSIARQFLWREGLDYAHGTGHGVGTCLSVHEGPQRISAAAGKVALRPGMVVSDEPGYYKDGRYGIRCENLLAVRELGGMRDGGGKLLGFETLTLVPFDRRLLHAELLSEAECAWLDSYHRRVLDEVGHMLEEGALAWLERAARPARASASGG